MRPYMHAYVHEGYDAREKKCQGAGLLPTWVLHIGTRVITYSGVNDAECQSCDSIERWCLTSTICFVEGVIALSKLACLCD